MRISHDALYAALAGDDSHAGTFERILGFGTSTGVLKGVHVMNDLAQCALGGAPEHGGDFLCRVIREHKLDSDEDNGDRVMREDRRFGAEYARAYPADLGEAQVSRLREGAAALLGFDGGIYRAGTRMASGLATHRDLLGFEGFRRFGVGRYIHQILGEDGRRRLREMFDDPSDPHSRGLAPLRLAAPLRADQPGSRVEIELTAFDTALGERITTLLGHPLTKTTLLRYVLLLSTLGMLLKLLGAGRPSGRPVALATTAEDTGGSRPARQEAVQAFARGVSAFYDRVTTALPEHPLASTIRLSGKPGKRGSSVLPGNSLADCSAVLIQSWRAGELKGLSRGPGGIYPPEDFAIALGRKAGLILPRGDQAGWGKHLALTTDAVEAVILSGSPVGSAPVSWPELWAAVREDLGLTIGAGDYEDAQFLSKGGVLHVDLDALARNSEIVLSQAVRRGIARKLPDSGAEAGGGLQ